MSKHTPGPWAKNEYGDLVSPDGEQVSVWGLGISHGQRDAKREANSRLIKASPDILKALKAVMKYGNKEASSNRASWAMNLARSAISKVEEE